MRFWRLVRGRAAALGVLATGVVCPCHALVGMVGLITGGTLLSPAAQDGVHAVYVPFAVLAGALLLRGRPEGRSGRGIADGEVLRLGMMEDDGGRAVLGVEVVGKRKGEPDLLLGTEQR
jgi:hypothetical protein